MVKATVAAIVSPSEVERNIILLTQRNIEPFKGYWCFPGGHIDPGETAEETGLDLQSPEFLGYCNEIFPEYNFHAVVLMFYGTPQGTLRPQPVEVADAAWFSTKKADSLSLAFNHREVLTRYEKHIASS